MNNKTPEPRHIIYLYKDSQSAQFPYRVWNPFWACKSHSQKWRSIIFNIDELAELKQKLSTAEMLIIERQTSKNRVIPDLIKEAKAQGLKVIFDLDDLIFDYRDLPLLMRSTNSRNVPYWLGYFWGIRRIAKHADGFLATNDFLAKKLKRSFRKPVAVIPNSLSAVQVAYSDEKHLKKAKPHKGFILGYFSGSPTHAKDFRLIEPEILKFLEDHRDAKLKVVGYMDFSSRAKKLLDEKRIIFEKPVDFEKLQEKIAEVDVNLAPLVENDFTNCKSELKFFEAAAVETTTIASPTFAFKNAIKEGETGFLARPGEWFDKIEYLYQNPDKNRKIALAAKNYCLENYYGKKFLAQVEGAYDELAK